MRSDDQVLWGPTIVNEETLAAMEYVRRVTEAERARVELTNGCWHATTGYALISGPKVVDQPERPVPARCPECGVLGGGHFETCGIWVSASTPDRRMISGPSSVAPESREPAA